MGEDKEKEVVASEEEILQEEAKTVEEILMTVQEYNYCGSTGIFEYLFPSLMKMSVSR